MACVSALPIDRRRPYRRRRRRTACQAAGVPTRFLHDCRRTAARNLIRANVPERVAMLLTVRIHEHNVGCPDPGKRLGDDAADAAESHDTDPETGQDGLAVLPPGVHRAT